MHNCEFRGLLQAEIRRLLDMDTAEAASLTPEATASNEAIKVEDLHKSFGKLEVLKGVSLTASKGDVVAIIGGSGSGKSTMLRCINFLETPSSGKITIGGELVEMHADGSPSNRRQIERVRTRLAMVFSAVQSVGHTARF